MKILKMFFGFLLMAVVLVSCKKDDGATPGVTGNWEGKFGELTETPTYHYSFFVKPDGTLVRLGANDLVEGLGEWQLNGTEFTGWYTMGSANYKFSLKGEYKEATGKITGSWGMGDNTVNGGQFYLNKK